ncbi:hypothetical protein BJ684DRAFT_15978 [Piptocephalis cylindrospora]|uniref:Nudix hydrolase domain-containing protein n=1 Tax=Piptocephalis cylindrospora TaxID=1907219 RepID=A0A4P9Y725_9FUNG|nr:hypothetical protein BJ684DRAFT_15978 [Piptocephalis cylindrospora]|eukprot:RKP13650.1 hypothetical protein BJ684DRAFT_15978 [Piptocephalis cylindrospora]
MSSTTQLSPFLTQLLQDIASHSPRVVSEGMAPEDGQPCRRAAVALVLRRPPPSSSQPPLSPLSLSELLSVKRGTWALGLWVTMEAPDSPFSSILDSDLAKKAPAVDWASLELLYIVRATSRADPWSGQVAFPGGKADPEDVSDQATAEREAFEEVGLDLRSSDFSHVGSLDEIPTDRPTSRSRRIHLIISPHVFLHVGVDCPPILANPDEVANTLWVPLSFLVSSMPPDYTVRISLTSRFLPPTRGCLTPIIACLLGDLLLPGIRLKGEENMSKIIGLGDGPILWGLSLSITHSLLTLPFVHHPSSSTHHIPPLPPYSFTHWPWRVISSALGFVSPTRPHPCLLEDGWKSLLLILDHPRTFHLILNPSCQLRIILFPIPSLSMFRLTKIPAPLVDYPHDLEGLGYTFTPEGRMVDKVTGEPAAPKPPKVSQSTWIRAYSDGLSKEVRRWMQETWNLRPLPLTTPEKPHATIYHSEDLLDHPSNILVILPTVGEKVGQWSKMAIRDVGMREGAVGSYVDMAKELGYSVVILCPGEIYWRDGSSDLHFVVHAYSGHILMDWLTTHFNDLEDRLGQVALIDSHHVLSPHAIHQYPDRLLTWFFDHACHWGDKASDPVLPDPIVLNQEEEEEEENDDSGWGKPEKINSEWEHGGALSLSHRYGCPHISIEPLSQDTGPARSYQSLLPHDALPMVKEFLLQRAPPPSS